MSDNTPALFRYGKALNTHDGLKILATLLMVVDHLGGYVFDDNMIFRLIGRGAAPIFFFLVGYSGKVHLTPFLFIYGIILSLTTSFIVQHLWINILLNFILIYFLMHFYKLETLSLSTRWLAFILMTLLTPILYPYFEYGFLGVLVAYSGRSLALKEDHANYWMGATLIIYGLIQAIAFGFVTKILAVFSLGMLFIGLFLLFTHYRLATLYCPKILKIPALLISRYSLPIYFYHLIFLQFCFTPLYSLLFG